jgi:alkanesulfonate monooxygenase SsuD/methylene tetrahydromethanopterin reductase-like flavin-dependent oxidoreductase (luciferase family)
VSFARVATALDDVSGGRLTLGIGAGAVGPAFDAMVLGEPELPAKARGERFSEFLELLDLLLREGRVTWRGRWYAAVDARSTPGCVQTPRIPFVVAANGPRGRALAARFGQGWVTTGPATPAPDSPSWWRSVTEACGDFTEELAAAGRDPSHVDRYVSLDAAGVYALSSVDAFTDALGRAAAAGFTDVLTHWPRPDDWYAGDEAVLEAVATRVLPTIA